MLSTLIRNSIQLPKTHFKMSSSLSSSKFNNKLPIYIPRVDTRSLPREHAPGSAEYLVSAKEFIAKQFKFQKIGEVDRVDLVSKKTPEGYTFYIAFVHFKEWYDMPPAHALQHTIREGKEKATLQYHKSWFWIVTENRNPRAADDVDLRSVVRKQQEEIESLTEMLGMCVSQQMPPGKLQRCEAEEFDEESPPPRPDKLVRQTNEVQFQFGEADV